MSQLSNEQFLEGNDPLIFHIYAGSEVDLSAPGAQAELVQTIIIRLRPVVFR